MKIFKQIICVSIVIIFILAGVNYSFASDNKDDYDFSPEMIEGPNRSMVKKGGIVNETFRYLYNKKTEEFIDIDNEKIEVEVSDPNIVTVENNIITAKEEGELTVKYKYEYNNMNFEYEGHYFIYDEGFTRAEYPIINKSYLNLKVGDTSEELYVRISTTGSYAVEYPEGYDYNTYYRFDWKVEDESIVKINEKSDTEITATALKAGKTNIICTISTADGAEKIDKTIKVTVTGENPVVDPKKEDPIVEPKTDPDDTVAKKILPNTGKEILIISSIFVLIILAIVFNKIRKIK